MTKTILDLTFYPSLNERMTKTYLRSIGKFSTRVNWLQINLGLDDQSNMIDIDQMIKVRLAKQLA